MQEKCGRTDVLRRLHEGKERSREDRLLDVVRVEQLVGEGRESDEEHRRDEAARELQQDRLPKKPPEPSPLLTGDVAKAELRQRLLDRQVEERLEEPHRDERCREHAVRRRGRVPAPRRQSRAKEHATAA